MKPERETAVRALLKGREVLAVLPTGYCLRKKRFCHCERRFQKALHRFAPEFQGAVNIYRERNEDSPFENYKSEEALRNTR